MLTEKIQLPLSTNATKRGPILSLESDSLLIKYDYEEDLGSVRWAELLFKEVLAYEYRQAACCEAEHIIGSEHLASYLNSEWLNKIVSIWKESVGWQEWQQQQGGEHRFKHFRIYFDDAACVDIVAATCSVGIASSDSLAR